MDNPSGFVTQPLHPKEQAPCARHSKAISYDVQCAERQRQETTSPGPKKGSALAEGCMKRERESKLLADCDAGEFTVHVDLPYNEINDVSKEFIRNMIMKACQINTSVNVGLVLVPHFGQCGVINMGSAEKEDLRIVTAKHVTANNSKKNHTVKLLSLQYPARDFRQFYTPELEKTAYRGRDVSKSWRLPLGGGEAWRNGWDVDYCNAFIAEDGPTCTCALPGQEKGYTLLPDFDRTTSVFEKVPSDFNCEVGQKIALIVSSFGCTQIATPETVATKLGDQNLSQDHLNRIYGPPGGIAIYTGEITDVSHNHIRHDINTFEGCSGAVIFLWDHTVHRGKAIAIHVGYHPLLESNIGLKIIEGLEPNIIAKMRHMWWRFNSPPTRRRQQNE